jgi:Uma2 family endonuclease
MTTTLIENPQRFLLRNISWQTYQALLKDIKEQPGIRLTYDRGLLEIMAPLDPHEGYKKLLGRFVETLTEELNINIRSLGSRTSKREDLQRGFEPDQCYYIQNEPIVRELEQIDLNQYPAPDLIIEIDITSSSINQFDLYGDFGVSEVWRYDGRRLRFYQLEEKQYLECNTSPTFPFLSPSEIVRFLEQQKTVGETAMIRLFREWVRSQTQ